MTDLARVLLDHFDRSRRAMPWRETADPYAIWVSEVMLQQTRVDAVVPYWERWMARFPTVEALADAELDDVLREWQGLGYYSRARNLHKAARMVRERHEGELPGDTEGLRRLPGIGEYTAGAVASIAFGERVPAVDGNVRRVLSRLHDLEDPGAAELRRLADRLVPPQRPGDFNQALMELGATICTPRSPECQACPVARWCRARELGVQEERPRRKRRKPMPEEAIETVVIVRDDHAFLLVRRPEEGLLGGLWEFPGETRPRPVAALVKEADPGPVLDPVAHVFTHKRITYHPRILHAVGDLAHAMGAAPAPGRDSVGVGNGSSSSTAASDGIAWVAPECLHEFALPVAQSKIARMATRALARAIRGPGA